MQASFEDLNPGDTIEGPAFAVSRESIRLFCDASLDYNPLHLDDEYMKGNFGKTHFGGVIMREIRPKLVLPKRPFMSSSRCCGLWSSEVSQNRRMDSRVTANFGPSIASPAERLSNVVVI